MKLTKKKLEQLITEEYVRSIGDEGKPTNYPQYRDKLTNLAKDDPNQARSLADSLDEPLDVEYNPDDMMSRRIQKSLPDDWHDLTDYVITAHNLGRREIKHLSPLEPELVKQWASEFPDVSYEELYKTLVRQQKQVAGDSIRLNQKYDVAGEMQKHHGTDGAFVYDLYESTEQQKTQQRKDNWDSRDRLRKRTKVKISKAKNTGESPFKNEPSDFDPIKDLGKAMKKQGLQVYANGEEIED